MVLYSYYAELGLLWCASPNDPDAWDAAIEGLAERAGQNVAFRESVEHALAAAKRWREAGDPARGRAALALGRALIPSGFTARFEEKIAAESALLETMESE